ncbi:uncharacterized protein LOC142351018 [Convolutriloba macropyga]|uniref:uncharacterized protein LOC142351018 n=1 Tax=Convolutriloba macropyga TaxID=536237 RepID=UPI003F524BDA
MSTVELAPPPMAPNIIKREMPEPQTVAYAPIEETVSMAAPNIQEAIYEESAIYSDENNENVVDDELDEDSNGEEEEYYVEQLRETIAESEIENGIQVVKLDPSLPTQVVSGTGEIVSAEPPKKRRRRRTVPPEVKKDNHKERERARRNLIKDRFAYLRATIPTLGENAHKMARTEVLEHVIEYIQFMRNRNQSHMIDIENLRVNNVNMEEQTKGLHMSLRCGYKLGGYTEPNTGEVIIDGVLPSNSFIDTMPGNAFTLDPQNLDSGTCGTPVSIQDGGAYYHQQSFVNTQTPVAINQQYDSYSASSYAEPAVIMSGNIVQPSEVTEASGIAEPCASPMPLQQTTPTAPKKVLKAKSVQKASKSSHNIVIPTTVPSLPDNVSFNSESAQNRAANTENGFGYESPEEEFIMLSELRTDIQTEPKNGKTQARRGRPLGSGKRRGVAGKPQGPFGVHLEGFTNGHLGGVFDNGIEKPRGRGRPRKIKSESPTMSLASVAAIERIIDTVVESGLPPKKKQVNRLPIEEN